MSDHDQPVAANLLDRQFTGDAVDSPLGGDTTDRFLKLATLPGPVFAAKRWIRQSFEGSSET